MHFDIFNMTIIRKQKSDMGKALLAAAKGHHTDIVMCILKKDLSIIDQSIKDIPLLRQAFQDGLSCVFEVRLHECTYVRAYMW